MDAETDSMVKIAANGQESVPLCPEVRWTSLDLVMADDNQVVAVLTALGHNIRWKLWCLLLPYGRSGLPAGTIAARMSIVPSSLSFHLRHMTQAGILTQRRSSRQVIYAVNTMPLQGLLAALASLLPQSGAGLQ